MSDSTRIPELRVRALWRRALAQLGVAAVGGSLAGIGALLLAGWLAATTALWTRPSPLPLILWSATLALLAVWLWRLGRRARDWHLRSAAAEVEERLRLAAGSLQGAIEPGLERPGTSGPLIALHRTRLAGQLAGRTVSQLAGGNARRARAYALTGTLLAVTALGSVAVVWLVARDSASEAWAAVRHPLRHLSAPPLPALQLTAEGDRVRRGRNLAVAIDAVGRDSVRLAWRPEGEIASRRWLPVSAGRAHAAVPRVEAATRIWAEAADGAVSDTLRATPVDPLLLLSLELDLRFPSHTGRAPEVLSDPFPVIVVPVGTRAVVSGKATLPLARVGLHGAGGASIPFEVRDGRGFRAAFRVRAGAWGWEIRGAADEPLEGGLDSLRFVTVADSAPRVEIVYPGVDTTLGIAMTQPLLVEVADDYGISRVELVSWRVSAWGERGPPQVEPLAAAAGAPRASPSGLLDARERGFLPGDTLRYFVRAYDNAPEPQVGRSREYVLRLPTLDEVRERAVADARDLVQRTETLADGARRQEDATRTLDRASEIRPPPAGARQAERLSGGVSFRDTEAARRTAEEVAELLEEAREVGTALGELRESIERAGLNDTSVLERLREIESLYERILTPELQEKLDALREALRELDPERVRAAIQQLAEAGSDFRQRLEQSLELLRRAALEAEFQTLETQARQLAEAHDQLAQAAESAGEPEDAKAAQVERDAAELGARAEALSDRVESFAAELERRGEAEAATHADTAARAAGQAAELDRQAAEQAGDRPRRAARSARSAALRMRGSAEALQRGRQEMQSAWRQEVAESLARTRTEALELARRQRELNERLERADAAERAAARSQEIALRRGAEQMREQLAETARSSLLVDPSLLDWSAQLAEALDQLIADLAEGSPARATRGQGERVSEALNELAYRLILAADAAAAGSSGTGVQEALEQLAQLAGQQGELNAQAGGLTPGAVDAALLQQLQTLAARQRAIGEQLSQLQTSLGPQGQVLGRLDQMGREAEELAQQLERGRLNERVLERQERLFHRLLDAGRSLERDELDRERRAERPGEVEILQPGALPADLLRGARFPHPHEETLRRYPATLRRLILEYFDRLNRGEVGGGT